MRGLRFWTASGLALTLAAVCMAGDQPGGAAPYLNLPDRLPLVQGAWAAIPAFPNLRFRCPTWLAPLPGTDLLVCCEREGRIAVFKNDRDVKEAGTLLDLSPRCQGHSDSGLLSLAFHPEFGQAGSPNRGFFYVYYSFCDKPVRPPADLPLTHPTRNRLARFTIPDGAKTADPASELVLIDQHDKHLHHNGGGMFFHPRDRCLYLALGDGGEPLDRLGNAQRIDRGLFSGVLRIDVDRNTSSAHPPPRQPRNGATANYFIPNDNPFVGAPGALEEFYALGLRNPHRMSCDAVTGRIFVADVGEGLREEINLLAKGGNCQWSYREGTLPGPKERPRPEHPLGVEQPPLYEYEHADGNRAAIGGFVYRGRKHPDLVGKYLFGDYASGRIWTLDMKEDGKPNVVELCRLPPQGTRMTSFGADANGEVYIMEAAGGRIYTLARAGSPELPLTKAKPFPERLSETGAFAEVRTLTPAAPALPYDVNCPLWSDHAHKRRWAFIPGGQQVKFQAKGEWRFPPGTVFVKHFELPIDERDETRVRRLETRFLVCDAEGGAYGATYRWRPDESDADLLPAGASDQIACHAADGKPETRTWSYPSRGDCLACHNANAKFVLGVNARQLNGDYAYPGMGRRNQLQVWRERGLFGPAPSDRELAECERLVALDDAKAPLAARARSYLDANCAYCHRPNGLGESFDARLETPPKLQRLIDGKVTRDAATKDERIVCAGRPERSALLARLGADDQKKMPPLGRNQADAQAVALLEAWIRGLPRVAPWQQGVALGLPAANGALLTAVGAAWLANRLRRRRGSEAPTILKLPAPQRLRKAA